MYWKYSYSQYDSNWTGSYKLENNEYFIILI